MFHKNVWGAQVAGTPCALSLTRLTALWMSSDGAR
jgi:hypothetical protein